MKIVQESLLEEAFNSAQCIILLLDNQGRIVHFNPYMETLSGYQLAEVQGCDWFSTFSPVKGQDAIHLLFSLAIGGQKMVGNINPIVTRDGRWRYIEWHDAPLRKANCRDMTGLLVIGKDVTDELSNQQMIATLMQSNQLLQVIMGHFEILVAYLDQDFNFILVNDAYAQADNREPDFFPGKNHFDLYPNAENEAIFRQVVVNGEPYSVLARPFQYAHDEERGTSYWDWTLVPVKDESGQVKGLILTLQNVTERIQALEQSQAQYKRIPIPVYTWQEEGDDYRLLSYNDAGWQLTKGTIEQIVGTRASDFYQDRPFILQDFRECSASKGVVERVIEYRFRLTDQVKQLHVSYAYVPPDLIMVFTEDVTDRLQFERQLQISLQEKETLLQEVHHRVKNNLQTISSLLSLQMSSLEEPMARLALQESRNRVRAMALVHEQLYRSQEFGRIRFSDYVHQLVALLQNVYQVGLENIEIQVAVAELSMDIDTVIACGLILNELVSNAFQHAFTTASETAENKVWVSMQAADGQPTVGQPVEAGHYVLRIADNGRGLAHPLVWRHLSSFGLQLVMMLVEQINGRMSVNSAPEAGTEFLITFGSQDDQNKAKHGK